MYFILMALGQLLQRLQHTGGHHVAMVRVGQYEIRAKTAAGRRWWVEQTTALEYARCGNCNQLVHVGSLFDGGCERCEGV